MEDRYERERPGGQRLARGRTTRINYVAHVIALVELVQLLHEGLLPFLVPLCLLAFGRGWRVEGEALCAQLRELLALDLLCRLTLYEDQLTTKSSK